MTDLAPPLAPLLQCVEKYPERSYMADRRGLFIITSGNETIHVRVPATVRGTPILSVDDYPKVFVHELERPITPPDVTLLDDPTLRLMALGVSKALLEGEQTYASAGIALDLLKRGAK